MKTVTPGFSPHIGGSSHSRFPVCDELQPRLEAEGHEWALELARWYEADWALALQGGPQPSSASVLPLIDPKRQEEIRTVLEAIDSRYSTVRDRTAPNLNAVTIDSHPNIGAAEQLRPAAPDQELDQTIDSEVHAEPRSEYENIANTLDFANASDAQDQTEEFQPGKHDSGFEASGIEQTLEAGGSETQKKRVKADRSQEVANSIPGYRIEGVLGRGGMGVVYLARQEGIDRRVALKMILSGGHADQIMLDRFQAEARAIGRFQHENIVRIFDSGFHRGMPYFSLEYVEGNTLSDHLDGKPIEPMEAAKLMEPMARALQYAHDAGVIHRDLKPGNVLLTKEQVPKITDFGLAKELETDEQLSVAGSIVGTPAYMAPEQARGDRDVGTLADVYGLGAMLYCMITGRPPFQGAKATDTLIQVIRKEPVEPIKLQPGIPKDLETICLKCLQKDKAQRYQSAGELAEDLGRFIRGEPISARPISRTERFWRWCKRNPTIATASGIAATLALIVMIGGPVTAAVIYGQKQEVENAKVVAEKNEKVAKEKEAEADEARLVAEQNADAAAVQEKNAIDALKSLTFRVQNKMSGQSHLLALREDLLQTVRNGLERMEKNQNTARAQNIISAGIHTRLGDINMEIGNIAKALEEYEKCRAILEKLDEQGELPNSDANWAKIHQLLGDANRAAGNLKQAHEHHLKSLAIRRRQAEQTPGTQSKTAVAVSVGKLGSLARARGDLDAAREYMEEATALRKQIYEAEPSSGWAVAEYLGAQMVLAKVRFQQTASQEAIELMTNAVLGMRELADRNPDNSATQQNAAMFDAELAVMQLYFGELQPAETNFGQAVEVLEKLQKENPNDLRIHQELEEALYGLAVTKQELGKSEAADSLMDRLLTMRRESLANDPSNVQNQLRLLPVLARAKKVEEGLELANQLNESLPNDATTRYHLAGGYALLAGAVKEQQKVNASASLLSPEELTELAIECLKEAMEAGFFRETDLRLDPDFDAVRDNAAFRELVSANA